MAELSEKKERMLDIFYRLIKGEELSAKSLAKEYGVSSKSVLRDISEIKNYFSESRELVGDVELRYSVARKSYYLQCGSFLLNKELFAVVKMLIGCRGFSKNELLDIIDKLKAFTTYQDRTALEAFISNEIYHYHEVGHDCRSVIDTMWKLTGCIREQKEITVTYYKMDRSLVERRLKPIAIIFSEYYYYLIAYRSQDEAYQPVFFRIDRIRDIVEHRTTFTLKQEQKFDEGELRSRIQFMFPGKYRRIRFEFSGLSVQAVLDRIPTARVVGRNQDTGASIIEAQTYGTGIKMYLLSQGSWVKVLEPPEFVEEMREEVEKMRNQYI